MKITCIIILTTALLLAMAFSSTGCDRLVIISGTVYEWQDAPQGSVSKIYSKDISSTGLLEESLPDGISITPLTDAQVRAFGKKKDDTFYSNEITDAKGHFRLVISLGQLTGDYTATVQAVHDGFYQAQRDILDKGYSHDLNILMVRQDQ